MGSSANFREYLNVRITFVLPQLDLSGGIRVISIYADQLRRKGHQVAAVSVRRPRPSLRDVARSILKKRRWPDFRPYHPSHMDNLAIDLCRLNHSGPVTDADVPDADVVIGTWWETVRWVEKLSPSKGAKVHFVQGYDIYGGVPEEVDATYQLPIPKIVISGWMRDLITEKFNQAPAAIVHNSVDTAQFFAPPRGKQSVPTVGMIYATEFIKGADVAIHACELARQQVPGLKIVAMGNYQILDTLPLPSGTHYTFQARAQKLREIYAQCDAWLFSSRQEGFGLPILEAMACRTPVIGTPAGAGPELISKGGGILVPHNDPPAMAQAIARVASLPDADWRALSDAALATVTGYTWDDAADQFEQALRHIAERCVSLQGG